MFCCCINRIQFGLKSLGVPDFFSTHATTQVVNAADHVFNSALKFTGIYDKVAGKLEKQQKQQEFQELLKNAVLPDIMFRV